MSGYFLYIIGVKDGPVKIGISGSPTKRLTTLQSGFHLKIEILKKWRLSPQNAQRLERVSHQALKEHRLRGEWFSCDSCLAARTVQKLLNETKNGKDWECHFPKIELSKKTSPQAEAGRKSAKIKKAKTRMCADKIRDRWCLPSGLWPTKILLEEAGASLNSIKSVLGKRPIAQYKYQAKMKKKAIKNVTEAPRYE